MAGGVAVCQARRSLHPTPRSIVEWNEILESVLPASGLAPPRHYAMLHIAMFDAVNSIERSLPALSLEGAGLAVRLAGGRGRAGGARHPGSATSRPPWPPTMRRSKRGSPASSPVFARAGQSGRQGRRRRHPRLAPERRMERDRRRRMCSRRSRGISAHTAGFASATSGSSRPPSRSRCSRATQYRRVGPPTLTSQDMPTPSNQVQAIGSATSTLRTAEQTQLARLFASVTSRTIHWGLWNHVARDTARDRGLSLIETARLYALLNVSIHDGLQTSHSSKFVYGLWRPVTAIRRADEDMNDLTSRTRPGRRCSPHRPIHHTPATWRVSVRARPRALALFHGTDEMPFTAVGWATPAIPMSHARIRASGRWPWTRPTAASTAASTSRSRIWPARKRARRWRGSCSRTTCSPGTGGTATERATRRFRERSVRATDNNSHETSQTIGTEVRLWPGAAKCRVLARRTLLARGTGLAAQRGTKAVFRGTAQLARGARDWWTGQAEAVSAGQIVEPLLRGATTAAHRGTTHNSTGIIQNAVDEADMVRHESDGRRPEQNAGIPHRS